MITADDEHAGIRLLLVERQLAEVRNAVDILTNENVDVNLELDDAEARARRSSEELQHERMRNNLLRGELTDAADQHEAHVRFTAKARAEHLQDQETLHYARRQRDDDRASARLLIEAAARHEHMTVGLQAQLQLTEHEFHQQRVTAARSEHELAELRDVRKELSRTPSQGSLQMQQEVSDLKVAAQQLRRERDANQRELDVAKASPHEREDRALRKELGAAKKRISRLNDELRSADDEYQAKLTTAQNEISKLQRELSQNSIKPSERSEFDAQHLTS